ncbi:hypothetical protein EJB05_03149, partial [Eragrostis curvula]
MASLAAFHPTLTPHAHPHRHPARPNPTTGLLRLLPPRRRPRPRAAVRLAVSATASPTSPAPPPSADRSPDSAASSLERCLSAAAGAAPASAPPRAPPLMKGGRKQFGAVTLEKAKLDLSQRRKKIMPECTLVVEIIGCNVRLSEARVAEETVEKPRIVKMKSRIVEMIMMDFRGKPPYDTVTAASKSSERRVTGTNHRMMATV